MNVKLESFEPIVFLDEYKKNLQLKAFGLWEENNHIGTLDISTGVGKTMIGIMAILKAIRNNKDNIIIIVPKVDLQEQWKNEILTVLSELISPDDIGFIGNGKKEFDKRIKICIINSIREINTKCDLLILDEIHRYGSECNLLTFENIKWDCILGLTATLEREDNADRIIKKYAPLLFKFTQKDAIDNNILSPFTLINIGLNLDEEERIKYNRYDKIVKNHFSEYFSNDWNLVQTHLKSPVWTELRQYARDLMFAIGQRKNIIHHTNSKIEKTIELIHEHNNYKGIIFCEFIKTANEIKKKLNKIGIKSEIYHSGLKDSIKKLALERFKNNSSKWIISVKALDEGTNIPDCDMALFVAGSSVDRQTLQRVGRILRKAEGKYMSLVFQLYMKNTKDYDWMKKRTELLYSSADSVLWE